MLGIFRPALWAFNAEWLGRVGVLRIHRSLISEVDPVQYRIRRIALTHHVRYGVSIRQVENVKPADDGVLPHEMSSAAGGRLGERSVACLPVDSPSVYSTRVNY